MNIKNLDDLKKFTDEIRSQADYKDPIAFAIGRSIKGKSAKTISVNYAVVNMNENYGSAAVLNWAIKKNGIKIDNSGSEFVAPINSAITADALNVFDFLLDECEGDKHKNVQNLLVIDEILNDVLIETEVKQKLADILFGNLPIKKKRIEVRKLRGLEKKFEKLFLKLLEYIEQV